MLNQLLFKQFSRSPKSLCSCSTVLRYHRFNFRFHSLFHQRWEVEKSDSTEALSETIVPNSPEKWIMTLYFLQFKLKRYVKRSDCLQSSSDVSVFLIVRIADLRYIAVTKNGSYRITLNSIPCIPVIRSFWGVGIRVRSTAGILSKEGLSLPSLFPLKQRVWTNTDISTSGM